jgi:predicted metal-binding membrane protein
MTTPDVADAQSRLARATWRAGQHAELGPALLVVAAWVALVLSGEHSAGMDMGAHPASVWTAAAAGLPGWTLMTIAMMGPAALARFRYVGAAAAHPARATAGFALAYLAVWAVFGFGVQAAAASIAGVPGTRALALVLLAAVGWQLSPVKRRLLRGSHREPGQPAAPDNSKRRRRPGSLSGKAALAHGLRYGLCCLGACWCLMLVMVAAPAGQLLWLAGLSALITAERAFPVRESAAAAALGVAALATLSIGGLF